MADPRIGTSAFTANGWPGTFYPKGLSEREYLTYYATKFDTVEVDSTFYRTPTLTTVQGWYSKTPSGFIFAAKVPQTITHEKMLQDCEQEMTEFLNVMDELRDKLGPLLFQFSYFDRKAFVGVNDFLARLVPFLKKLPKDHKFAVEIRNKGWLVPQFIEALRERGVALALIDQSWMPLSSFESASAYPDPLRKVSYYDAETNKRLKFLTNNFTLPALTIAQIYKQRWQVELFFKWIKQHLRIKAFYGTSENAVKTQIWIAVSVYVLVAIVRKQLRLENSLYQILQILSVTLFEKTPILQALQPSHSHDDSSDYPIS